MLKRYVLTHVVFFFILGIVSVLFFGCSGKPVPKPRGFYKIDFPVKAYEVFDVVNYPFIFEIPKYASVEKETATAEIRSFNIKLDRFNGTIHMSYKKINRDLHALLEDSRTLAYKHTIKADAISNKNYENAELDVYGTFYDIEGNAASSVQFYLTDSVNHFLRGALYFYAQPNKDSLAPVIDFIKIDVQHLIETFQWK